MATSAREAVRWVLKGFEVVGGGGGWIVSVTVCVFGDEGGAGWLCWIGDGWAEDEWRGGLHEGR